ncbi:cytochrome P450 CYP82J17-like [Gossypium arboreum]|uniref:cytochrome P450 CYP82J17-like n=1 Tax=Gossypium arboreum TaxID=29729 RepID=UPI0022F16718|nr:cytochrome P450 CYP82J17-like [Gossypium arboreum]
MKKVAKDLDQVAEEWLREHKEKRAENVANSEEDFMGVLLSVLSDTEEHEADTINKATSLVKQELDIHVGKDKLLLIESDTKNLVYLQSVIKKTLRLYPAAPLSVTHEAIEDCSVSGYHVSAGYDFELIPFNSGRRMCPGYLFALKILELTLANVLRWFEFETPSGETVDMRESPGLTNPKATPLEVHITPRLPTFVYQSTN